MITDRAKMALEMVGVKAMNLPSCLRVWLVFLVASVLFHHKLLAAPTQFFSGPVTRALGGGNRAGAEASEVVLQNPAAAALAQGVEIEGTYHDGAWRNHQSESGFALTILENSPENISPGGFTYIERRRNLPGIAWKDQYIMGVLAKPILPNLMFGASVYYLKQKVDDAAEHEQWNGSLGTLLTLSPTFGLAFVYSNPVRAQETIPVPLRTQPQLAFALSWTLPEILRFTFDISRLERDNPDKKGVLQWGLETKLSEFGAFRLGYELDDIQKENYWSMGFGVLSPRAKFNYAFTKATRGGDDAMHSVDFRVPF